MKILILCPNPKNRGGITNYYQTISKYLNVKFKLHYRSGLGLTSNKIFSLFVIIKSYVLFILISPFYDIIHFNTSLNRQNLIRDSFFLFFSKLFNKKNILFIRGWDEQYSNSKYVKKDISKYINNCAVIIVLSLKFKKKLIEWGADKNKIIIETTTVDDSMLIENKKIDQKKIFTILFLARIEKNKGIYELLNTFKALQKKYKLKLIIAGEGSELDNIKNIASNNNIDFKGFVSGNDKIDVFLNSDIYVFPTSHDEGMPNSILEAMAYGLPIISRPVGGLIDFFENNKMGYLTESLNPEIYFNLIEKFILDKNLLDRMGEYNKNFANKYFLASKVSKRIECIYNNTYNNKNRDYFWKEI